MKKSLVLGLATAGLLFSQLANASRYSTSYRCENFDNLEEYAAYNPECSNGRCVIESIPVTIAGFIDNSNIEITVINVSNAPQDVLVEVFTKGDFGIDNNFGQGFGSYAPTLNMDDQTCQGILCIGAKTYGCTKSEFQNIPKGETLHNLFHIKLNNGLSPSPRSGITTRIRASSSTGALRALVSINYNSPFLGIGTGAFGGFVTQSNHYFLNGGRPF